MKNNNKKGFSLVETLVYIGLTALVLVVIVNVLVSITRAQRNIKASRAVEETLVTSFDRMVREIREARTIDPTSNLGVNLVVNAGGLVLNSVDSSEDPRTIEFFVDQGILKVEENGVVVGPLMPNSARITSLIFKSVNNSNTDAVRIEMAVESGQDDSLKSSSLTTTTILRGSY
ncbi:MAG: prepilin-type N-terminal cleavage/methylation domain-containing protein [Patescibacteria group bacterium]